MNYDQKPMHQYENDNSSESDSDRTEKKFLRLCRNLLILLVVSAAGFASYHWWSNNYEWSFKSEKKIIQNNQPKQSDQTSYIPVDITVPCDPDSDGISDCVVPNECLGSNGSECGCLNIVRDICVKWDKNCSCKPPRSVCGNNILEEKNNEDCDDNDDIYCQNCSCRADFVPNGTGGCKAVATPNK